MKILRLETRNFKRLNGERTFTFEDGITSITGSNGNGKSTIASAIAWVLYGPEVLDSGKSDVITWGEKECSVELSFEYQGETYNVTRSQKSSGASDALLDYDGRVIAKGIDPVNREVERLLGLDRVGFLVSVYSKQEDLSGLMSLTPANRKKTVLRLLGIEKLTEAIEKVRSDGRDTRKVLEGILGSQYQDDAPALEQVREDIAETHRAIKEEEERLVEHMRQHDDLLAEATSIVPLRQAFDQYRERRGKAEIAVSMAEAELRSAQREASFAIAPVQPKEAPQAVDEDYYLSVAKEFNFTISEIERLTKERDGLKDKAVCPTCNRPFDNADDLRAHYRDINAQIKELTAAKASFKEEFEALRRADLAYKSWERKQAEYEKALALHEQRQQRAVRAAEALERDRGYLASIEPVEDVSERSDALQAALLKSASAAGQIRGNLSTLAERLKHLDAKRESMEKAAATWAEMQAKVKAMQNEVLAQQTAASLLGSLKDSMIAEVIPNLEVRASNLVSEFTDGRYTEVNLTPDYEVQFRNYRGDLKSFNNLSGGEKDVFALALRLAISDLRAESLGVLILDEVMESLDPERQDATWQAIERLGGRYDQILFITHVQGLRDRATKVISV